MNADAGVGRLQKTLGYLGLLPFVGLSALLAVGGPANDLAITVLKAYAFGIGSFILGSWWRQNGVAPWPVMFSNILFVIYFSFFVGLNDYFLLVSAFMLIAIYLIEYRAIFLVGKNSGVQTSVLQCKEYKKFRCLLTSIASLSLGIAFGVTHYDLV